ncbi:MULTISPECIES: glycerophosphodiester phosphodiesterase family protein [Niastella]|uniref:Glycerophosphodiester phosphodiesterase family protein n=1 Tax=Niastella soli TaxID=2821487 RepID=A0ABS3Z3D2_9BACT|nr:glycerophosphodiester phosphodiesterase family protein [Niastella soli]MBO9204145.1 glycerophosphodiester phosphodiesterase family protein [Niastella soli]
MDLRRAARQLAVIAGCFIVSQVMGQSKKINVLNISTPQQLQQYFKYTGHDVPLVSGHRGGPDAGAPENSLEAFEHSLQFTPATFEIDPRLTKDSVIVLLHDDTLDRTTTGKGKLNNYTWAEVKKMQLKDVNGKVTPYRIPTLEEAIIWAKGKTVLILDKKDVPMETTAALIKKHHAEAWVMITVHNAKQAKFYYDDNKNVMFEAFVKTKKAMMEYEEAGIPWQQIMAYIGPEDKPENKELIDLLHQRGVMCMISSAPTYDKLSTAEERAKAYAQIIKSGVDVIEADKAIEAANAIRSLVPASSEKNKFFGKK